MRISDWISDVCSSDLRASIVARGVVMRTLEQRGADRARRDGRQKLAPEKPAVGAEDARRGGAPFGQDEQKGFAEREGGVGLDQKDRSRKIPDNDSRLARRHARPAAEHSGRASRREKR